MSRGERALRVAMVCPYDVSRPGGVKTQVLGLSRALRASGHEVLTIAPGPPGALAELRGDRRVSGLDADTEVAVVGRSVRLPANGSVAPVCVSPLALGRAVHEARAFGADVVHLHEPLAPILGYGFFASRRWPLVATFHRSSAAVPVAPLAPLIRRIYGRLEVKVAVSGAAASTARALTGKSLGGGDDFEVLFNGVDTAALGAPARAMGARTQGDGAPVVLFVGRHEARKGLGVLLDAFEALADHATQRDPVEGDATAATRAVLWIVGDGPQTSELRARHPASERVRWFGELPDAEVARCLAGATVLAAPSLGGESFGLVLVEAMATQTAVVCSDIPGYRGAAGGHATLVPPGDPAALARALREVLARAPDARSLADASAYVRTLSMERLATSYAALYALAQERHERRRRGG